MDKFNDIIKKIDDNAITVGIIGLGYVGLPLAVGFAKCGIKVIGFEKSVRKIEMINKGINYIEDISENDFRKVAESGLLSGESDFSKLKLCDAIFICVPTPLDKFKKPDMSFVYDAGVSIGSNMKKNVFVCLESTVYPTATENFLLPIIERKSGLKCGSDFWLAFSPERIDPGNKTYKVESIPKIIGAMTEQGLTIGMKLYSKVVKSVHPVSSPKVAEMTKILENTYRFINISLINEMALLARKMDIDIWEVIEAAKTKPYGFNPFYPSSGIGGHCIPLDPFYLEYIAKNFDFDLTMIEAAGHINNLMPHRMQIKISSALNKVRKSINGSTIFIIGVAYKADIDDDRESAALKLIDEIVKKGGNIIYHDPYIDNIETPGGYVYKSSALTDSILEKSDCVVFNTKHSSIDWDYIVNKANLVVDLCNAMKKPSYKVFKL